MSRPFVVGERVLLFDSKQRRYLVTLAEGAEFHTHAGYVRHEQLLGQPEGTLVRSTAGARYTAVRPTLADFVLKMPRARRSSTPRTSGRSSCSPTSSPAPASSNRGSGQGRCR